MSNISDYISCSPNNSISSYAPATNPSSLQQIKGGGYSTSIHNELLVSRLFNREELTLVNIIARLIVAIKQNSDETMIVTDYLNISQAKCI